MQGLVGPTLLHLPHHPLQKLYDSMVSKAVLYGAVTGMFLKVVTDLVVLVFKPTIQNLTLASTSIPAVGEG